MNIIWHRSVPPDIRKQAQPWVTKYRFLLPGWLNTLTIRYQDNVNENWVAEIDIQFEYRQAKMTLVPAWREYDEVFHELTIAHELVHVALAPMDAWCKTLIDSAVDETLRPALYKDWERMHEGSTEDISNAVCKRIQRDG